jgi:hypothetical protein
VVCRVVLVLCLAGCDQLFALQHLPDKPDAQATCPSSYNIQLSGSTSVYRYEPDSDPWLVAETLCERDAIHAHLIVLDDDDERLAIVGSLASQQITASVWIGLTDRRIEDTFQWVTIQPVGLPPRENPPWGTGQPDDSDGNQDCTRIQGASNAEPTLFDDAGCGIDQDYVCECDSFPADTRNY